MRHGASVARQPLLRLAVLGTVAAAFSAVTYAPMALAYAVYPFAPLAEVVLGTPLMPSQHSSFRLTRTTLIPHALNAAISGQISGDAISGTISYAPAASDNPDCASLQCTSTQNFNGTRPPSAQ